ncbi:MAG: endolytic transglycosylase MltG [Methanococcaceae archaeon]
MKAVRSSTSAILRSPGFLKDILNKVRFRDLLSKREYFLIGAFFIIVLTILYINFFTPNYYTGTSPRRFEIKRGESLGSIAERLHQEGIIPSEFKFKVAAYAFGAEKRIRSARFYIPNGLSYAGLIDYFLTGKADVLRAIKIFDGSTVDGIAARLQNEVFIDSTQFTQYVNNQKLLDSLKLKGARSVEGYLLPGEYFIFERSTPQEALQELLKGMDRFLNDTLKRDIAKSRYSLRQILTIASIVNGETQKYDEMPRVAGVYYNRLRIGMRLQADPTVQYILKERWRRLSLQDLKINSPYNTYMYAGLPPGPINNPGKKAILAAVYPEKNDYLYFVADGKGGHKFAATFSQHQKNVQEYRNSLNK